MSQKEVLEYLRKKRKWYRASELKKIFCQSVTVSLMKLRKYGFVEYKLMPVVMGKYEYAYRYKR